MSNIDGHDLIIYDNKAPMSADENTLRMIDWIRFGVPDTEIIPMAVNGINLDIPEKRTGFTILHMAAAVGSRTLVDAFCSAGAPNFRAKDARGRTPADVAAIVARDFELCAHIYKLEAKALQP